MERCETDGHWQLLPSISSYMRAQKHSVMSLLAARYLLLEGGSEDCPSGKEGQVEEILTLRTLVSRNTPSGGTGWQCRRPPRCSQGNLLPRKPRHGPCLPPNIVTEHQPKAWTLKLDVPNSRTAGGHRFISSSDNSISQTRGSDCEGKTCELRFLWHTPPTRSMAAPDRCERESEWGIC